jgi:hypothetical protein
MKWTSGRTKRHCDRALPGRRAQARAAARDEEAVGREEDLLQLLPRLITPSQPGGPTYQVGNFQWIPCKTNGKWVGILWNRQAKGAGRPRPAGPPVEYISIPGRWPAEALREDDPGRALLRDPLLVRGEVRRGHLR